MNPEAQRMAIAEYIGLVTGQSLGYGVLQTRDLYQPDQKGEFRDVEDHSKRFTWVAFEPVYDLNAIHEAEKKLSNSLKMDFIRFLNNGDRSYFNLAFASAAQHAEAFIKAIGKWRDE